MLSAIIAFLRPGYEHFLTAPHALSRFEQSQPHMGTVARIVVYAPSSEAAAAATRSAFERIRELDSILSDYQARKRTEPPEPPVRWPSGQDRLGSFQSSLGGSESGGEKQRCL